MSISIYIKITVREFFARFLRPFDAYEMTMDQANVFKNMTQLLFWWQGKST